MTDEEKRGLYRTLNVEINRLCCLRVTTVLAAIIISLYILISNPNGDWTNFVVNSAINARFEKLETDEQHFVNVSRHMYESQGIQATDNKTKKVILLYTPILKERFNKSRILPERISNVCRFTTDNRDYTRADAVIFHSDDVKRRQYKDVPDVKPLRQLWIYFNKESPVTTYRKNEATRTTLRQRLDDKVDLTMTYMREADVPIPYGGHQLRHDDVRKSWNPGNRTKLIVWYVSHCVEFRLNYAKELSKFISLDTYGRCGEKDPCDRDQLCLYNLNLKYKFYLALENSFCKDYVTEKFWNALKYGMIPVVMGMSMKNYEELAPPDSFLHVDNFTAPEQLADYIKYLDTHPAAYLRYHKWRSKYDLTGGGNWWLRACDAVQSAVKKLGLDKTKILDQGAIEQLEHERKDLNDSVTGGYRFSIGNLTLTEYWTEDRMCTSPYKSLALKSLGISTL